MVDEILPVAIQITGGEPIVEFNHISADSFDQVIRVEDESAATIINHKLIQGNYGVYCVNSEPEIHFNNIQGNAEYGVFNETSETHLVNAEDNWWCTCSGPYHNPKNLGAPGDEIIWGPGQVDSFPWQCIEAIFLVTVDTEMFEDRGGGGMKVLDMNGDGVIGISEAIYVLQVLAEIKEQ